MMTEQEKIEYDKLLDYFLERGGDVTSKSKIDRLNELGRLSVDDRKKKNSTGRINIEWTTNKA